MKVLCFGDSHTYGYSPRGRIKRRWTQLLTKEVEVIEDGVCGRTTIFGEEKGIDQLRSHKDYDSAILFLGTNDLKDKFDNSIEEIGQGICECLDVIKENVGDGLIILIAPPHLFEGVYQTDPEFSEDKVELSKKLSSLYMHIAYTYGIEYIDASSVIHTRIKDNEHFSSQEHAHLAKAINEYLR